MKRLKVSLSVICAVILALSVSVPAFAAETAEDASNVVQAGGTMTAILFFAVLVLVFASMAFVVKQGRSGRANVPWAVLAIILAGLALMICVVGYSFGTLYTKPDGDPKDTVETFFTALEQGDYQAAYPCLSDYTSLGLENEPADENGKIIYQALRDSYSHTVMGDATISKLSAFVPVRFRYLNIKDTESSVEGKVTGILEDYVENNPHNKVYDANDKYLPEVTDAVYSQALNEVMAKISNFYTTEQFNIELEYKNGEWYIITSPELLNAIIGGTAQ